MLLFFLFFFLFAVFFFFSFSSACASVSQHVCVPVTEPGPPSPPDSVTVEEVTDSTAQLAWSRGRDNGSPIANYFVQTRTPFTVGWQRVNTGGQRSATVVSDGSPLGNLCRAGEVRAEGQLWNEGRAEQIQGLPRESRGSMLLIIYGLI